MRIGRVIQPGFHQLICIEAGQSLKVWRGHEVEPMRDPDDRAVVTHGPGQEAGKAHKFSIPAHQYSRWRAVARIAEEPGIEGFVRMRMIFAPDIAAELQNFLVIPARLKLCDAGRHQLLGPLRCRTP